MKEQRSELRALSSDSTVAPATGQSVSSSVTRRPPEEKVVSSKKVGPLPLSFIDA